LLHDRLQATQPETEGFRGVRAQDRISVVGLDCSVQNRTTARHRGPVIDKISNVLLELLGGGPTLHTQSAKVAGKNRGPVPTKVPTVARLHFAADYTSPYF
jgi:hypothetical protein